MSNPSIQFSFMTNQLGPAISLAGKETAFCIFKVSWLVFHPRSNLLNDLNPQQAKWKLL